jgi:hypothetical protein
MTVHCLNLHISKNGPPLRPVHAILPSFPSFTKYSLILTLAPTNDSGNFRNCSRSILPTNSFAKKNFTPAATAASMISFEGS